MKSGFGAFEANLFSIAPNIIVPNIIAPNIFQFGDVPFWLDVRFLVDVCQFFLAMYWMVLVAVAVNPYIAFALLWPALGVWSAPVFR